LEPVDPKLEIPTELLRGIEHVVGVHMRVDRFQLGDDGSGQVSGALLVQEHNRAWSRQAGDELIGELQQLQWRHLPIRPSCWPTAAPSSCAGSSWRCAA